MIRVRPAFVVVCLSFTLLVPFRDGRGQYLSPGKLSAPHEHLEGLRKCTSCHELRRTGASGSKCLECHEPLRTRIDERRGYHTTVAERSCGSCHTEHRGHETTIVELDTTAFPHTESGFQLVAGHADIACRKCHQPEFITASDVRAYKGEHGALERTMLGLDTRCLSCHEPDDPHTNQFADRSCDRCHAETSWKEADRFDHSKARYRLTGQHRRTECVDCHKATRTRDGKISLRFKPLDFASCESCHEDEHGGKLGSDCTRCHTVAGWHRVERSVVEDEFDHSDTDFPLVGKHADTKCEVCHAKRSARKDLLKITIKPQTSHLAYPHPDADRCTSCHLDYHRNAFQESTGGIVCDNCHDEDAWTPGNYDIDRHNRDSAFSLEGAHLATPCSECHPAPAEGEEALQFPITRSDCESCHRDDDPHRAQFAENACADCHDARSFMIEAFDHAQTRYPLDGAHDEVPCESCHLEESDATGQSFRRYKPLKTECRDCHSEADND